MWRFLARFKTLAGVVLLLILPFAVLHLKRKVPAVTDAVSSGLLDVSGSIQEAVLYVFGSVFDSLERYYIWQDFRKELFTLRFQKRRLASMEILLEESEQENQRLRHLLNMATTIEKTPLLGAAVIGEIHTPLMQTIQLDQGSKVGIQKGDAVISDAGAVGQVLSVGKYYSQVLLLSDASSAVDVVVQRSRAKGILRGLQVRDFDRLQDIRVGDILVTSGLGARFPEGTPVGLIKKINFHHQGLYLEATVEPFVDFRRLEQVLVLRRTIRTPIWRRKEIITQTLEKSVIQ